MKRLLPLLLLLLLLVAGNASACNIPVFRYALERWQRDLLDVFVFYEGKLNAEDSKLVAALESASSENGGKANVRVVRVSLDDLSDSSPVARLWQSLEIAPDTALPYVVSCTPATHGPPMSNWQSTLTALRQTSLLDSPVRQELCRRLLSGHAVVWLMLTSPHESQNARVRQLLLPAFEALAEKVSLPDGIGLPGSELFSEVPLLPKFSLLELDRSDINEDYLIEQLSGLEREAFTEGQPLLIPVFGRGRALEVIPLKDLDATLVNDITGFLSGACSCQVKELNPGFDLLLSADWERQLFGQTGMRPPPSPGTSASAAEPTYLSIPPGSKSTENASE